MSAIEDLSSSKWKTRLMRALKRILIRQFGLPEITFSNFYPKKKASFLKPFFYFELFANMTGSIEGLISTETVSTVIMPPIGLAVSTVKGKAKPFTIL